MAVQAGGSLLLRAARRSSASGLNLVETGLTALAFIGLREASLIARIPVWVILVVLAAASVNNAIVVRVFSGPRIARDLWVASAIQAAGTFAVIYATGWGPTLVVGYMFIVADNIKKYGARAARPALVCGLVAMAVSQVTLAIDLTPSLIKEPEVHGLAVLSGLGLVFAVETLRASAAAKETAEADVRRSEERFRALVQQASDAITVVGYSGEMAYVSPTAERLLGTSPDRSGSLVHAADLPAVTKLFQELRDSPGDVRRHEFRVHVGDSYRWFEATFANHIDDPAIQGIVVNYHDVHEKKEAAEQLAHAAYHDAVTGFVNRPGFTDRLNQALARATRRAHPVAVLFLDLDNFKAVNDTLGHHFGDQVLIEVAKRLALCVRAGDSVGRFGGDEFTVLLEDLDPTSVARICDRVVQVVQRPIRVAGREIHISGSVGVVVTNGEQSAEELLRDADLAMYQAKSKGRARWQLFDAALGSGVRDHYEPESALRVGVRRGELVVHYQPAVLLPGLETCGFEALVRWQHPERGLLSPGSFIPLAEGSDLVRLVDLEVLRQSCAQAAEWTASGYNVMMSVNVSARSLDPAGIHEVLRVVHESGLDVKNLILEVTERIELFQDASTNDALLRLREAGIRLVVDDFGIGYSSLARLQSLPVDGLKVDRAFIDSIDTDSGRRAIVAAITMLARELGLSVVVEGVETAEQLAVVTSLGCDMAQGYYLAHPMPVEDANTWLGEHGLPAGGVAFPLGAQRDGAPDELPGLRVGE